MMDKRIVYRGLLVLTVWCATIVSAQDISVASFKFLENDLTANTTGTMERDQNGEIAALIKVVTTEQGFVFDGGMVGVVKTKQGVGEVWVYVPHGIKKMTIQHPQLGVLRDYYFPMAIDKAKTYEMVLSTGKVETVVTHSVNKQFVVFNVKPTDAVVELSDEVLTVDSEGYATKSIPFGTYDYRVSCANYHTEAGKVTVNAQGKAEVNVTLRPNFGWIKLNAADEYHGAYVFIDNERVGQLPFSSGDIKSGIHHVRVAKSMYKAYETQVTVADNETSTLDVVMVPNFAPVTFIADEDCEIWIDGEKKGEGEWNGPLEPGEYMVEVKKTAYRSVSEIVRINGTEARTIRLKSPVAAIRASLEIVSTPLRATVLIDGVEVGETPLMKNDVLVGTHRVVFKKDGYGKVEKMVVVEEKGENRLSVELVKKNEPANDNPIISPEKNKDTGVPDPKPSEEVKRKSYRCFFSVNAGASTAYASASENNVGFNYGVEAGLKLSRFMLSAGVKSHLMGGYEYYVFDDNNTYQKSRMVQLLRFSAKVGLTFGRRFQFTPQAGILFGPSYFIGREYVMGEIPTYEEYYNGTFTDRYRPYLIENADYSEMNADIVKFAHTRLTYVVGARIELLSRNARWGIHVTPEYVVDEGFCGDVGLTVRF